MEDLEDEIMDREREIEEINEEKDMLLVDLSKMKAMQINEMWKELPWILNEFENIHSFIFIN